MKWRYYRPERRICGAMLGVMVVLGTACVRAQELDLGAALYENHCHACHESSVHVREQRVVRSLEELRARVTGWSVHSGLDWRPEQIEAVTGYLNWRYYHFPGAQE